MGAFRISDIKADTASIPLKYHASVASTRDFSSPRWRRQSLSGSSTEITSKRVNSLAVVATSIRGGGEKENAFPRTRVSGRGREFAVGSACDVSLSSS